MPAIDFTAFDALTFDCYGTLIDWDRGILGALAPVLANHGVRQGDDAALEAYARHEAALEAGPYLRYREVLAGCLHGLGGELGIDVPRERILHVAQSFFHDHVPAQELGMTSVWVDRRRDREGHGATPPAQVTPDLAVPDMRTLADMAAR